MKRKARSEYAHTAVSSNCLRAGTLGMVCAVLLAFAICPTETLGVNITSWPYAQNFNTAAQYSDLVNINSTIMTYAHQSSSGWNGSGCPKFTFLQHSGEDDSGLGSWFIPKTGPLATKRINVRYLVWYGSQYANSKTSETKSVILHRCNEAACDTESVSSRRGMLLETGGGNTRPYPCYNIECSGNEPQQLDMPVFDVSNYINQWVSYETEWDTSTGVTKIYIDTLDGVFQSRGGTTPWKVYSNPSQANNMNWSAVFEIMGYWEATRNITANSYFMLDELAIDRTYIGPPSGFGTGSPAPTPMPPSIIGIGETH